MLRFERKFECVKIASRGVKRRTGSWIFIVRMEARVG